MGQRLWSCLAGAAAVLALGGCGNGVLFSTNSKLGAVSSYSSAALGALPPTVINTMKNQAVTFAVGQGSSLSLASVSLGSMPGMATLTTADGAYSVASGQGATLVFTPAPSFVGTSQIVVSAGDALGNGYVGSVKVIVGNTLNAIKPSLAVRGMSCVTCHSGVASTILTDYGYGNAWFMDAATPDSFYLDRANSAAGANGLATLDLSSASQIMVPAAPIAAAAQGALLSIYNFASAPATLAQFVAARFAQGGQSQASQVKEIASLTISIPTAARIEALFGNPNAAQVYYPDTQNSPALSGLGYDAAQGTFVVSNLVCDGDLYLGAPAVFEGATVQSINGCRIYATGSIFVDGPLRATPYLGSVNYNIQLMSARSVWMGAGRMLKNGVFCERDASGAPTGWYSSPAATGVNCALATSEGDPRCDSFYQRAYNILKRNTFSRAFASASDLGGLLNVAALSGQGADGTLALERAGAEAALGYPLYDASCEPGGRGVSLSRLMVVAPYVNNRYSGNFSGSVIAEAALMSLGAFQYQFDPVFSSASIFSLLNPAELISGNGL
jgi:hypothetical protein